MKVKCDICGKEIERAKPRPHNFCGVEHRDLWSRTHTDFAGMSRGHKAKHLTELNKRRNPLCRIVQRGKGYTYRSRKAAEAYLERKLVKGEVVHHINGNADDNAPENLLVMTDRQHKQLHMALAYDRMEESDAKE